MIPTNAGNAEKYWLQKFMSNAEHRFESLNTTEHFWTFMSF